MADEESPNDGLYQPKPKHKWTSGWNLVFILLVGAAVWFFARGKFGFTTLDNVTFWIAVIAVLYMLSKAFDSELKRMSPVAMAEGFKTTIDGKYIRAGDYLIFRMDGFSAFGLHYPGNGGGLILPVNGTTPIGESFVSTVQVDEYAFEELPIEVRRKITRYGIPPPYVSGLLSKTMIKILNENEVADVMTEMTAIRRLNTMLSRILKDKGETIQGELQRIQAIANSGNKKSFSQKVKESFSKPESE